VRKADEEEEEEGGEEGMGTSMVLLLTRGEGTISTGGEEDAAEPPLKSEAAALLYLLFPLPPRTFLCGVVVALVAALEIVAALGEEEGELKVPCRGGGVFTAIAETAAAAAAAAAFILSRCSPKFFSDAKRRAATSSPATVLFLSSPMAKRSIFLSSRCPRAFLRVPSVTATSAVPARAASTMPEISPGDKVAGGGGV